MMDEQLQRARHLAAMGCSVIPIDHPANSSSPSPGKTAAVPWKAFQTARPTDDQIEAWFGRGILRNIGIVTGAVSNLVVIDCDSPAAIAWADAQLPPTPWRGRTGKGEHRGYRHPGVAVKNAVRIDTGDADVKIDVRGDGGYVVGPGSTHENGTIYEWIGEPPASVAELPFFDAAWLTSQEDATPSSKVERPLAIPEGRRNDTLFKECGRLMRLRVDHDEVLVRLLNLNEACCLPPLARREVEDIVRSRAKFESANERFPPTEAGDAEFFADRNADSVRYDHRQGRWLLFNGHVWVPQTDGELDRLVLDAVRARQSAAVGDKDLLRWAVGGETRRRLNNMCALAQSIKPIADAGDRWDPDPWLLGTPNGVVDLRTGALRPGRPDDRVTMVTRAPYDPHAPCPLWTRTVSDIFAGDNALIQFVQRAFGYSVTGSTKEQVLFMCWGDGANGKGTLMNTVAWVLNHYADDLPFSALELSARSGTNDIAKLVGKRFVTSSETSDSVRLNEARIKALTGSDPITARFLYREFFTFEPAAKFWLATNHKPVVVDDSLGFWRRIHLIPFTESFLGRRNNPNLREMLRAEAAGILRWAVDGCLAWQREGLSPPPVVVAATSEYRTESDVLAPFFDACCVIAPNATARASELYAAYEMWFTERRFDARQRLSQRSFGMRLRRQFAVDESRHVRYTGIGLSEHSRRLGGM